MVDKKISELPTFTNPTGGDKLVGVDSGTTKQLDYDNIFLSTGFTGQIAFPETAVPSADPNTLDDYEEVEWTPIAEFGGASVEITYATQLGFATKNGNTVIFSGNIALSDKGSSNGDFYIGDLPFIIAATNAAFSGVALASIANISFADIITAYTRKDSTRLWVTETTNAGVRSNITEANLENDASIAFGGTYQAA